MAERIEVRPCELTAANAFIEEHHRHHKRVQGHRFSLSAWADGRLVGVATVGRPVARMGGDPKEVLEVTRLCTDGTPNACSALYAAAARVGREMGYRRIQTYVLASELGTSLKAAGWSLDHMTSGDTWTGRSGRSGRRDDQPHGPKARWSKVLRQSVPPPREGENRQEEPRG